ncbi:hypothetical protein [Chlorella virus XW01]|nr:hypothetical protein [Chlorella virus XW01]
MDYINQSPYFNSNNLKRFILYRNIRTNKIKSITGSFINADISYAYIKDLDCSNADISYAYIKDLDCSNADISYALIDDLEVQKANIKNLNVQHDITLNNNPYLPIGIVLPFATTIAPEGWLVCNGQEVSKTTYASLWNIIGNTFGVAVDSNNFKLPDLRGRVIIGNGAGDGLTNRSIGQNGGSETHTLTINEIPSHTHTGTTNSSGAHNHTVQNTVQKTGNNTPDGLDSTINEIDNIATTTTTTSTDGNHTHTFTTNSTGGGQAHNIVQPFTVLNYIIKYRV